MEWPPKYFAVLQDGDGEPRYFRGSEADESADAFALRIGKLVARDIEYPRGTTFVDVIDGTTGLVDADTTELVIDAMTSQKELRRQARQSA